MIAISAGGAINAQRHAGLDNVLGDQYKDRRDPAILYELSKAVQVQRGTAYEGRDGDRVLIVVVVVAGVVAGADKLHGSVAGNDGNRLVYLEY